jgi:hypothetical protein
VCCQCNAEGETEKNQRWKLYQSGTTAGECGKYIGNQ